MALKVGELFASLSLDARSFDAGINAAKGSLQGVDAGAQKVQSSISRLGSVMGTVGKASALAFAGAGVAVAGLGAAALKSGISYNALQQSSRAALTTILGSAQAANAQMDKLDDFARNSPFAKQVFIRAQQQLLGFGLAADKVIPSLDAIQNAVAAVGGSNDDIGNITYALAQMQGQGKLTGETLNQLGQYGIDAASILGAQFGKTGKEIREMASKPGGIPVEQVWDPLVAGLQEKFGGAAANVKQTWAGATDRIKAAWRDIGAALAEPFVGHAGGGVAIDWVNKFADLMRSVQKQIAPIMEAFKPLIDAIGAGVSAALDAAKRAVDGFDTSRLVAGINQAVEGFRGLIDTLRSGGIAGLLQAIAKQFDAFAQSMFGGGYTAAKTFAQGMVDGAAQFVTQAIDYITGLIASYLIGHSPTEEGPLSEIDKGGQAVMEAYVGGMRDGAGGAQEVAGDIAESFAAVGANAADADSHVRDLTGSINDLRDQQDTIKNQIEDIERGYQDQIGPLEDQLDALKNIVDIQREQEALAISLEQSEIKRAITAAKGDPVERARLQAQLDSIQQQQEENRLTEQAAKLKEDAATAGLKAQQEQLAFRKEEIRIAERQQSLMEDAAEGKDVSADLAELDIQRQQLAIKKQLAESKSGRDATASKQRDLELQQQENALKQQLNALTDKGAIAELEQRKGVLDARKDEIDAQKEQEDLQRKMAALPLEQRIKELKAAQEDATQPLKDQQELLSRRQEILESEKRKWSDIKSEAAAVSGGSKGKGGSGAGGGGLDLPSLPSGGLAGGLATPEAAKATESPAEAAGKVAGQAFSQGLSQGIGQFIRDNLGKVIGGALGGIAGGSVLGPPGAIIGGLLGGFIGQGVQDELAKRGIDVSPLLSNLGDMGSSLLEGISGPIMRVVDDLFPILRDRWNEISPEIGETLGTLGKAFDQFVTFVSPLIEGVWSGMVPIIDGASKIIVGIVRLFLDVIQLDWDDAWNDIKAILDGALEIAKTILFSSLEDMKESVLDAWDKIKTKADEWWEKIKTAVTTPIKDAASWLDAKWEDIKKAADGAWSWIKTQADTWWGDIKSAVTGPIDTAKTTLDTTWENLKTKATDTWDGIKTYINDHKQEMIDVLKAPFQWLQDNVGDFLKNAANTVITKLNTAGSSIGGFVANAGKALNTIFTAVGLGAQFSESNPWRDIPGLATGGSVVEGGLTKVGEKGTELLWLPPGAKVIPHDPTEKILSGVDSGPMHAVGGPADVGKSILSGVKSVASSAFDTITSWVKQGADWVVGQAFGNLGVGLDLPGVMSSLGGAVFGKVKTASIEMIKTVLDGLAAGGDWVKPLLSYLVTQEFGPASGALGYSFHTGIDMAAPAGSSVRAAKGGRVASAGWNDGYGNAIILEHANNLRTLYGHLQSILVGIGDMVRSGQTIGLEGSTGNSTGPHLHFETMQNGARVNPRTFIPALAGGGVFTSPTLALLAETARAQPEIVTPERLMRQVVREELGSLLGGGGGGPINITVQSVLDGRVVGESVAPTVVNWMGRDYMRRAPRR